MKPTVRLAIALIGALSFQLTFNVRSPSFRENRASAQTASDCVGDCNGDVVVSIDELVRGVGVLLGRLPASDCEAFVDEEGNISVAALVEGVGNSLTRCGRVPLPTATPDRTATAAATLTAAANRTPTQVVSPTAARTGTKKTTPTRTPTPSLFIGGGCFVRAQGDRVPCPDGVVVEVFRCAVDPPCEDVNQLRHLLGQGRIEGGAGRFSVGVDREAVVEPLLISAQVGETIRYRTIDIGSIFTDRQARGPVDILIIDAESEGVTQAIAGDELANFSADNLTEILQRTREEGLSLDDDLVRAAGEAQEFAKTLIDPLLSIELDADGRFAYYILENRGVFDYKITTVAIDGGSGQAGIDSCRNQVPPGGVAVADDIQPVKSARRSTLLTGRYSFDPGSEEDRSDQGMVCLTTGPCVSFDDLAPLDAVDPIAAQVALRPQLNCEFDGAHAYAFGTTTPTKLVQRGLPAPSDGLQLPSGTLLVFSTETTFNEVFGFGVGGFRLGEEARVIRGFDMVEREDNTRTRLSFRQTVIPSGVFQRDLVAADLDRNGFSDLVIVNEASSSVSVFLSDDAGRIGDPRVFVVGAFPRSVAVADIVGDQRLDLLVANEGAGSVSILRGQDATPAFTLEQSLSMGEFPSAVAVGNLGGDERTDVVVALEAAGIAVRINQGAGNFAPPQFFSAGSFPIAVAVGDLDGMNFDDVVVLNEATGSISVLRSGPSGLSDAVSYVAAEFPSALVLADLNDDDRLDVAVASPTTNTVAVLLNHRDGTFGPPRSYRIDPRLQCINDDLPCPAASFPTALTAADIDGDKRPDLLTVNESTGDVSLLVNRGDGALDPPQIYAAGEFPTAVAAGDLSASTGPGTDGRSDLIVVGEVSNSLLILSQR